MLAKLNRLNLLNHLFPKIVISTQVRDEVVTHGRGRPGSAEVAHHSTRWASIGSNFTKLSR